MSLLALPDTGYTYLSIEKSDGSSFEWSAGETLNDNAQFWLDKTLVARDYTPAIWWKFWKPTITFKVFACGGTGDPFYQTVKLQEK